MQYAALRFRKTAGVHRDCYIYEFADGHRVTLHAQESGVTERDILLLHRMDDHEVYINLKASRLPLPDLVKARMKAWKALQPHENPPKWRAPTESWPDTCCPYEYDAVHRLHELIADMQLKRQAVYELAMLEGMPNTHVAVLLGVSEGTIRKDILFIRKKCREDRILQSFFHAKGAA